MAQVTLVVEAWAGGVLVGHRRLRTAAGCVPVGVGARVWVTSTLWLAVRGVALNPRTGEVVLEFVERFWRSRSAERLLAQLDAEIAATNPSPLDH
jgi:hypothetical protein